VGAPRWAGRTDANHREIRDGLRAFGASVYDTSAVGHGFPDLVVGWRRRTELIEVKNPDPRVRRTGGRSMRATRERQASFRRRWLGRPVHVVTSLDEAIAILTAI
jgi:hypothetical protein